MRDIGDRLFIISNQYFFSNHQEALAQDNLHKNYDHIATSEECT